jgi:lipid II isoglutaminyl synthase (glutamine-hydrolysing)
VNLRIIHLYPRDMNLYADVGNVVVLARRAEWAGHDVELRPVDVGDRVDIRMADLVVSGGGPDAAQGRVALDFAARAGALHAAIAEGMPMLFVCGMFQLAGRSFVDSQGHEHPGAGLFDMVTLPGRGRRVTGRLVEQSPFGELEGFENHAGVSRLAPTQPALGRVLRGSGNWPGTRREGAITGNAIGTYLHGPVLARNPNLADHLLAMAIQRRTRLLAAV